MKTSKQRTQTLVEGAVCIALALVLSIIPKIDVGAQGGSISLEMLPLLVFAIYRGGIGWGVLAGLIYGTLTQFLSGFAGITWQSILLDYSLAYAAVGLAGLFRGRLGIRGYALGALVGCAARFVIHFISGVTIYAEYAEAVYFGVNTPNSWIYSVVYNGFYMLPNTIAAIILVPVLGAALTKIRGKA